MIRYNEPGTAKGSDPLPVGQAQCVLAGLAFSKAPLWCPTHGRWHGGFDLRRDKVVAAIEAHGRRPGRPGGRR